MPSKKPKEVKERILKRYLDQFLQSQKPMFNDLREIEELCELFELKWGIRIQTSIAKQPEEKGGRMLLADEVEKLFTGQDFTLPKKKN